MESTKVLLQGNKIDQKVRRMAYQIWEDAVGVKEVVIIGIAPKGSVVAKNIAAILKKDSPLKVTVGELVLDKDKPLSTPITLKGNLALDHQMVVLIDDVLNSGKTMIYAAAELLKHDLKKLRIAVLVDRNHKRFPIHVDYVGMSLSTTLEEHIEANFDSKEAIVYLK